MNEKELWKKFEKGGKITDYIEYRNCVNMKNTELEKRGEDYGSRTCDKGTEHRGVR